MPSCWPPRSTRILTSIDETGAEVFRDRLDRQNAGRVILNRGGNYTINVLPVGDNFTGAYSFRLRAVPPDPQFPIAIGDTVSVGIPSAGAGNISTPGERDVYAFNARPGEAVFFQDLGGAFAIDWQLFDESGTELFRDRLDGSNPGRYVLNRGGRYTIAVFGATTASNYAIAGLVDWRLAAFFILGGILGGVLGSFAGWRLSRHKGALSLVFAAFTSPPALYISTFLIFTP